ncbi:MAG: BA14K family protein [Alphaproteobacteria bacterium]|nr:BA14K family protein [Alphaproteobacteria bacterium]
MTQRKLGSLALAFSLSAGVLLTGLTPAAALPRFASPTPGLSADLMPGAELAKHKKKKKWNYNKHRHGERRHRRDHRFRFYFDGYYYRDPFWLNYSDYGYYDDDYYDDGYDDGYYDGGGSAHVQWCLNRYRSYNPRTDSYTGYDGLRHRCYSPYR